MIAGGQGQTASVQLLLQEAITLGLAVLGQDRRAVEELCGRQDELHGNTADAWRRALRDAMLEMVDPASDQYAQVLLGYPPGDARLPAVSIVTQSGGEDTGAAVVGDVLRVFTEPHGPSVPIAAPTATTREYGVAQEVFETTVLGHGETTTLQVGAWSPAPERSFLLIAAIRWALQHQKHRLLKRGVHEVTARESGFEPSEEMEPRVGWVPMLSVTLSWTFRQSYRRKAQNRVKFTRTFST